MRIIKTTLVAGLISLFATFSTFAEKVKLEIQVGQVQQRLLIYWQLLLLIKWVEKQNLFQETTLQSMVQLTEAKVK
jgi:hypothetical protein